MAWEAALIEHLARNRRALALRGAAAIALGIACLFVPETALIGLILLVASYLMLDGVLAIAAARERCSRLLLAEGLTGIAAALFVALFPALKLVLFVAAAALRAMVSGALLLAASRRLRRHDGGWRMRAAGGVSLVWGVLVVLRPMAGVVVFAWWIGAYGLIFGALMVTFALRLPRRDGGGPRD